MTTLAVGQLWTYQPREKDKDSHIKIIRIDENCIHIAVRNVVIGAQGSTTVHHLPFAKEIIENCVLECIGMETDFPELEGVAQWEAANGGVFSISVIEALEVVEKVIGEQLAQQQRPKKPDIR